MTATLLRLLAALTLLVVGCVAALQYNSKTWPFTEGEVALSGWSRDTGFQGSKGVYTVHYEYSVDGESYNGDRVSFASNVSLVHVIRTHQGDGNDVLRSPHPGDTVRVHYAPWWPAMSTLVAGPSPTMWIWCVVAGLCSILCLVFAKLSHHPLV